MNILHVNNIDLLGNRFNGHDMQIALNAAGIEANQIVMERMGDDPHTHLLTDGVDEPFLRHRITECEKKLSLHGMIYPYMFKLMDHPEFKKADIVHYHLLHNYWGALPVFPEITKKKPSVLTIHDPWIFTGHCIYPKTCERWKAGCGACPDLTVNFPMRSDRTQFQWAFKKSCFEKVSLDLVVASQFMLDFVKESPITRHIDHVHLIPFGIDIDQFSPNRNRAEIRHKLGIPDENFVLCFRADPSPFKGFDCIHDMLKKLSIDRPISLIAVGNPGMLAGLKDKYQILDLAWVTDNDLMADLYCACDLFLMPSTAEAFGLMAIEAMASARPVLVCEGTSLPSVTFAPECGIVIPQNDSAEMGKVVARLAGNPRECETRGRLGRELAEKHYRFDTYVDKHLKLYEEILSRS